jgi:predicted dehydrogenase
MISRVLVIGTGFGAAVHIPALEGMTDVATASLASGRSGDWQNVVAAGDCDLAVVAVPPTAQVAIAETILKAGIPVLLEKPGGMDGAQLAQLGRYAPPAAVGYSFRFARGLTQLIEQATQGVVGDIRHVAVDWITSGWASAGRPWSWRCDRKAGGGVLRDMACHSLDYLRLLLHQNATDLTARTRINITERRDADGRMRPVDAPDQVDLLLDSPAATARVSISSSMPQGQGHRIEVHGTRGRLTWNHAAPFALNTEQLILTRTDGSIGIISLDPDVQTQPDARISAARRQLRAFLQQCAKPTFPQFLAPASLADARIVLDMIVAAECSADENRSVTVAA